MNRRLDTTGWAMSTSGNCARNRNFTIRINGIYTTQQLSRRMRHTNCYGIWHTKVYRISAWRPDHVIIIKKKRTFRIMDFAVPAEDRVELKESEKKDKYQNLVRELIKPWNMKLTVIPIVTRALGTVTEGLIQGLKDLETRGWVETIQTRALFRLTGILRRILETRGDLLLLTLQLKNIS